MGMRMALHLPSLFPAYPPRIYVERIKMPKRRVNWVNLKFLAIIKPNT
jgi:hypothetical protein